jgi:hypothetical protein
LNALSAASIFCKVVSGAGFLPLFCAGRCACGCGVLLAYQLTDYIARQSAVQPSAAK